MITFYRVRQNGPPFFLSAQLLYIKIACTFTSCGSYPEFIYLLSPADGPVACQPRAQRRPPGVILTNVLGHLLARATWPRWGRG